MTETTKYRRGVQGILSRAKRYRREIGNYEKHFIGNSALDFVVSLSNNGRLNIPIEIAHDQETQPSSIAENIIREIADTFKRT